MRSCRGHEFTPIFGLGAGSDAESSSSSSDASAGEDAGAAVGGLDARTPSDASPDEVDAAEDVAGAFADAKDRWKIDANSLKGFYFHSPTQELFSWEQARGLLYKYDHERGDCDVVWAASTPQLNAEIWTLLPLPPTDPASLTQPAAAAQAARFLCVLTLSRARALQRAKAASEDFCARHGLDASALATLQRLPAAGQLYVVRTFCAPSRDASGALRRQVRSLQDLGASAPWAGCIEGATVRVPATGAILGRCIPEIAGLCWEDSDRVAPGHCRVAMVDGRFSVCDLASDEGGTLFDGRRIGGEWVPLRSGCSLELGPVRIDVELTPVHTAASLPPEIAAATQHQWQGSPPLQRRPPPARGSWREAKRARPADTCSAPCSAAGPGARMPVDDTLRCGGGGHCSTSTGASRAAAGADVRCAGSDGPPGSQLLDAVAEREDSPAADLPAAVRHQPRALGHAPRGLLFDGPAIPAPRAECVGPTGTGRAFWAAPRDPSPSPEAHGRSWLPRTPP